MDSQTEDDGQPDSANTGKPADRGGQIRFAISLAAHEYVKSKTTALSALREAIEPDLKVPSESPVIEPAGGPPNLRHLSAYPKRLLNSVPQTLTSDTPFWKDYARIVHSPSFRRLQGKTQLVPAGENDFFRTRLTHSLEVAEVARRIAVRLNDKHRDAPRSCLIEPEIVVCASLLHDIGHPPFGHSGEETLNRKMDSFGGFEGNAQTLRIATKLENRLGRGESLVGADADQSRGLNLTIGTLAGILKYDVESTGPTHKGEQIQVTKGYYTSESKVVDAIRDELGLVSGQRLHTIECQIMDIADDIAYSAYDLEDTLESGIVTPFDLMSIDDETLTAVTEDVNRQLSKRIQGLRVDAGVILYRLADVFGKLILDGESETPYDFNNRRDRLVFVGRTYLESVQHAKNPLVRRQYLETLIEENIDALSLQINEACPFLSTLTVDPSRLVTIEAMKAFNFHRVIASRRLQLHHQRAQKIVGVIFDALAEDSAGKLLSEHQRHLLALCSGDEQLRMRLISDIISSFTDAEAMRFYDQLQSSRNAPFMGYAR